MGRESATWVSVQRGMWTGAGEAVRWRRELLLALLQLHAVWGSSTYNWLSRSLKPTTQWKIQIPAETNICVKSIKVRISEMRCEILCRYTGLGSWFNAVLLYLNCKALWIANEVCCAQCLRFSFTTSISWVFLTLKISLLLYTFLCLYFCIYKKYF